MIKKEINTNFKSFIIWTSIIIGMYIIVFLVYPSIAKDAQSMNEMLKMFPRELLEHFNMDVIGMSTVFGWVATEGFMMLTLVGGCFFAMLGANILLKEENDKTIEFLYSKPINRNKIVISKLLAGFIYILLFNLSIAVVVLIGLILSDELELKKWILLSLIPIFLHLFFFTFSFLLSIFFTKTGKSTAINLGGLFIFYLLNVLSAMSEKIEFLKYLSPFYYINARSVLSEGKIEILNTLIVFLISLLLIFLSFKIYNKKELL
jgi:ABC-2 type transport system permease protein